MNVLNIKATTYIQSQKFITAKETCAIQEIATVNRGARSMDLQGQRDALMEPFVNILLQEKM